MKIRIGVIIVLSSLSFACRQHPSTVATGAEVPCAPPAALPPAGRVRIDGWLGPQVNDSLVLVVDGRERWRGLYEPCTDRRAAAANPAWRPDASDSIRSVYVIRGDTVRRAFHIGGAGPSALLIETVRR